LLTAEVFYWCVVCVYCILRVIPLKLRWESSIHYIRSRIFQYCFFFVCFDWHNEFQVIYSNILKIFRFKRFSITRFSFIWLKYVKTKTEIQNNRNKNCWEKKTLLLHYYFSLYIWMHSKFIWIFFITSKMFFFIFHYFILNFNQLFVLI